MELLAYIKELLLLNDCVIIPGFGGFITNYKPSTVHASRFTPPTKSVSFNKKLNFNDGLFINHVASQEGINYVAASQKVDLLVQELNYRLTDGEEISISGLGVLRYDAEENLIFTPRVESNLNLDSFGLAPFNYETLFARRQKAAATTRERDAVQVIFQKRTLKKVLVAVPVLLALALTPLKNNKENLLKSDLGTIAEMMTAQTPAAKPVAEENAEVTAEEIQAKQEVEHRYFMIGGSFRDEENAVSFVSQMKAKGYDAKNIGIIKGLNYISLGSFASLDEARSARDEYKVKSPGSGVWIYVKE